MNESGCHNCPAKQKCDTLNYRGSRCAELRAKVGAYKDPTTNADRIRAMSDEKLAEFLDKVHNFPCEACCDNMERCLRNNAPEPVCKRHYLDWLRKPAEEEET